MKIFGRMTGAGLILLLLLSSWPASAAEMTAGVSETRLANGLKVILLENHKAPMASFQVWYRAGSRNDPWGKTGLAHFFEHLMFKGTPEISKEEFARSIQQIGGNFNAFTSHDFAGYFENVAGARIEIPVRLEADRMRNLDFTEAEFETEKKVVTEERKLRTQDQPIACLMEQTAAAAFVAQPYHWPVVGWMADLMRIEYSDALQFYRRHYDPANALIVAVGDFEGDALLGVIREAFESIPTSGKPADYRYRDPPQKGQRRVRVVRQAALPFVAIGYHVPNFTASDDGYVLEVIAALLSAGKSSRIYENLVRGKQVAVSAGAEYSFLSMDPPLFYLYAEALPGISIDQVEQALNDEVEDLQHHLVGDRELEKAKNQLEAAFVFGQDSVFFQAMMLARYEIVSSWRDIRDYLPSIRSVSAEDIRLVAKNYFHGRNRTVGLLVPEAESPLTAGPKTGAGKGTQ